jgi:Ribonuclease G/E
MQKKPAIVKAVLPSDAASYLLNRKRAEIANLESLYKVSIIIEPSATALSGEGYIETTPHELQS